MQMNVYEEHNLKVRCVCGRVNILTSADGVTCKCGAHLYTRERLSGDVQPFASVPRSTKIEDLKYKNLHTIGWVKK